MNGHDGKVSSLCWSNDDQKLVSCAEDGSLYEWDVPTGNLRMDLCLNGMFNIFAFAGANPLKVLHLRTYLQRYPKA